MNTSTKNFTLCIFAGLLAIACGNSNSKRSEKEIEELNAQAKIPESVKPIEKSVLTLKIYQRPTSGRMVRILYRFGQYQVASQR